MAWSLGGVKRLPSLLTGATGLLDPVKNVSREYNNRWKQPGDELTTNIPGLFTTDTYAALPAKPTTVNGLVFTVSRGAALYDYSDARVASTDNIRMNNITLSYMIPNKFTKRMLISDAMISIQATNIFLIADSKWQGRDPEQTSGNASLPSTFTFNVNLNF
jgi:hypothetical protein